MSDQKLNTTIESLTADLEPVRPLLHPFLRTVLWAVPAMTYIAVAVWLLGVRYDVSDQLTSSLFLLDVTMAAMMSLSAAAACCWLSIPDMKGKTWILAVPASLLAVFLAYIGIKFFSEGVTVPEDMNMGYHISHCARDALLFGAVPFALLLFVNRRAATTRPNMMGLMSLLAIGGLGWTALRFTCPVDEVGHVFLYHFLPFVAMGSVIGLLARRLFRW